MSAINDSLFEMYFDGEIDAETLLEAVEVDEDDYDVLEEGGCEKSSECYDEAIELLNSLKENPNDSKAKKKLKDIIDDCCDDDDDDDEEETTAEESTITFESEEPIVEEIMESVSEMDRDLKYVDAVLESSIIMTEAPEVLNTVVSELRNRMKNVNSLLNDLKSKMVKIKDSKVKEKIARILKDLAKRFNALLDSAKTKVETIGGPKGDEAFVL